MEIERAGGVVFLCDRTGLVSDLLYVHPDFEGDFTVGKIFMKLVPAMNYDKALMNFTGLRKTGALFNTEFVFLLKGENVKLSLSAIYKDGICLIAVTQLVGNIYEIFQEMKKIKNRAVVEHIAAFREMITSNKVVKDIDLTLYEQISRLSAELIAAKADIERKNAELSILSTKLDEISVKDVTTGLFNRKTLDEKFRDFVQMANRLKFPLSIIMFDINNFRKVNEKYGMEGGDKILKDFGDLINAYKRKGMDNGFRIGSDEFLLMVGDCDDKNAIGVAVRLDLEFQKLVPFSSLFYGVVGVDVTGTTTLEEYLVVADERLNDYRTRYRSKSRK
jgi:diguanylate cyclase (GGDEF)-like protein